MTRSSKTQTQEVRTSCFKKLVQALPHPPHALLSQVTIFTPFKNFYNLAMDSWIRTNSDKSVTIYSDHPIFVNAAHLSSMTPPNIVSGFCKTHIFPYNWGVFTADNFAPSKVTNRAESPARTSENVDGEQSHTDIKNLQNVVVAHDMENGRAREHSLQQTTLEDVDDVLVKAKLDADEFSPLAQSLKFSGNIGEHNDLILLELDQSLLDKLMNDKCIVFRGEKTDEAVLCTKDTTFEVKEAETSNALLISPGCKIPDQIPNSAERSVTFPEVLGIHHMYYELRQCKPKLQKIRRLLEENLYCGEEYETEDSLKYNLDAILDYVQGSENEIVEELVNMHACYVKGYWRLLDHGYQFRVVNHIMEFIDANFSVGKEIPKSAVLDALEDLEPRSILDQVFGWYADKDYNTNNDSNDFKLNEENICRFFAEVLLRPVDKFVFSEFMEAWKHSVPDGIVINLSYLQCTNPQPTLQQISAPISQVELKSSHLSSMSSQKRKVPENGDVSRKTARCSAQQVAAILDSDDKETLGFDEDYSSDELETDSDDDVDNDNDSESDSDNENPADCLPVRPIIVHNLDSGWNKKYVGVNKQFLRTETGPKNIPVDFDVAKIANLDMVLTDTQSTPPVIWYFPTHNLPYDINERFNLLFKTREKWTHDEITPFIQDLATLKLTVNAMLTKYARTSNINGTKFYNSKKPVT
ncbi:Sister chromatid cohesion protein DCC1 [Nymphon striatum]|nr:Sister chromatid cohesion protein DCC1 [Nymphon striatum]